MRMQRSIELGMQGMQPHLVDEDADIHGAVDARDAAGRCKGCSRFP